MKRSYLIQGLFALLVLGLGLATAQNINRSVQLSQDPSGPVGFDSVNGIYFPGHQSNFSQASPTISGFGTGALTGTDVSGEIVEGTGAVSTGNLTFARAWNATPYCQISANQVTPVGINSTPNGFVINHALTGTSVSMRLYYYCSGGRIG